MDAMGLYLAKLYATKPFPPSSHPKKVVKMCEGIRAPKMAEQLIQVKDLR